MMSDPSLVKEIITYSAPLIKSVVDVFVAPKLEQLKVKIGTAIKLHLIPTENHFKEYYFRSYKKYSFLNTLVFSNSQRLLKDIYLPLSLTLSGHKDIKYKITGYPISILEPYRKILITDTAGMGKSTLMKRIFLDVIDSNVGITILIELRRLSKDKTVIQEIHEQLNSINKDFDENFLLELINEGDFIFLLDGYDEIPLSERDVVTLDIQNFISKAGNNKFILTSRPESALSSFGDFQQFNIQPLNKDEAFELLKKYDDDGEVSNQLIKKLKDSDLRNIEEFLTNPLLVSLLFTAFEHKQVIPFKKHIFYRQVYDANFESHDLTKGESYIREKYSGLDIDDFHRVLRFVGFSCLKEQKIEYTKDEILKLISGAKRFCSGIDFQESAFIKDLITTVPLFIQDGIYFRWAHKSLQEYFAAQFIFLDSKEQQKVILERLYNTAEIDKYYNLLDLYYDIDFKGFRRTIIFLILKEFEFFCSSNYTDFKNISSQELEKRKELSFWTKSYIFKASRKYPHESFDEEKYKKMFGEVMKNEGNDLRDFYGSTNAFEKLNNISTLEFLNPKLFLLDIINKRQASFTNINYIYAHDRLKLADEKYSKIKYNLEEEYKPILINDDPNQEFNSLFYFQDINFILSFGRFVSRSIDYKKGMDELKRIRLELQEEEKKDYLLEGL